MTMTATYCPDDNRLRLYSVARLDKETYDRVKAAGFRWAPMQKLFFAPTWSPRAEDLLIELCGEIGDEDTTLTERAEERADRFEDYSDKRLADAEAARKAVAAIAEHIPFAQPILVGHHSEKSARRDKEKIDAGMRKSVKMWETSTYWTERAAGAIRHAKYKELPAVRHRRIKTIEADKRKSERERSEADMWLKLWTECGNEADTELQAAVALRLANMCWLHLPRKEGDSPALDLRPTAYDALTNGHPTLYAPRTLAEIVDHAKAVYPRTIAHCNRWIAHYENRMAYERAMLAEQIGAEVSANPLADRFAFAVGGQVQAGRSAEWVTVLKVNKGANGSVSSLATTTPQGSRSKRAHWRVESVHDYRAPSAENVAAAKAATKLPPMCNYPGEGFREMSEAEWNGRRKWSDFPYTGKRAATDTAGAHRVRQMPVPGKMWEKQQVFLTDAKRVDPPKVIPPSEPADAAEFVAEFVTAPEFAAQLETVAEIMGAAPLVADVRSTFSLVAADYIRAGVSVADAVHRAIGGITDGSGPRTSDVLADLEELDLFKPAPEIALAGIAPHDSAVAPDAPAFVPLPVAADFAAPSPTSDFEAMRATLKGGGVQVVVAPQLFPTPRDLAEEMVTIAEIEPGHIVLEPSAGTGAIIGAMGGLMFGHAPERGAVHAVEINGNLAERLRHEFPLTMVHCGDFLDFDPSAHRFDRVLMNPPFSNMADLKHIEHARKFLKPGGRLVAICADGPRQRERLQLIASEYRPLPAGTFKAAGTMVNTALVVIDAPPA